MIPREILKRLRRIEIRTSRLVNETFAGSYQSVFKGRGVEFSEVREYQLGDEVQTIDWNVTSRMGHPFVKKYVEERELTVMLLFDASRSGDFGTKEKTKRDIGVEICALIAFSAIKNNDRVGLMIFTDCVEKYVPPKKGHEHVMRVIRDICYYTPTRRATSIHASLDFLNRVMRKHCVVFLVSDFIDSGYERLLKVANKKHDLIAVILRDPRETALPKAGLIEMEDAETGASLLIDTGSRRTREIFARETASLQGGLMERLGAQGIDAIQISTDEPYQARLESFFRMRARKLRV